jgi:deoxyribose-phosphate aldolase
MIRPDHVVLAKETDLKANSGVQVGTVIDFPEGKSSFDDKLLEAKLLFKMCRRIDFVCNYKPSKQVIRGGRKREVIQRY